MDTGPQADIIFSYKLKTTKLLAHEIHFVADGGSEKQIESHYPAGLAGVSRRGFRPCILIRH
jgi:hypothetical protein